MTTSPLTPIHLHKLDSDTLTPEKSWEGNGVITPLFAGQIFWGACVIGVPLALVISGCIRIHSPIQLALMVVIPMILSLWTFVQGQWRIPLSLAMLVYAKFVSTNDVNLLNLVVATLAFAIVITLIFVLFKLMAGFDGPWMEIKRSSQTMQVYKSRFNKKLIQEVPLATLAFGINIREVRIGKYTTQISYFLSAYHDRMPFEFELLFSHSKSELPPEDYLETYGPLCEAVQKFLGEWAQGKQISDSHQPSATIRFSETQTQFEIVRMHSREE